VADHIDAISTCALPRVSVAEFWRRLDPNVCTYIFCSGRNLPEEGIELGSHSPWSHVLRVWMPCASSGQSYGVWSTLEATLVKGVHVGTVAGYIAKYDGDLVVATSPMLTVEDQRNEIGIGLGMTDESYDPAGIIARAVDLARGTMSVPDSRRQVCNELQWYMRTVTSVPLGQGGWQTPEAMWMDTSIEAEYVIQK
jgi:hypothetical protein